VVNTARTLVHPCAFVLGRIPPEGRWWLTAMTRTPHPDYGTLAARLNTVLSARAIPPLCFAGLAAGHTSRVAEDSTEGAAVAPTAQTPSEFLAHVRALYARIDRDDEPDQQFKKLTDDDLAKRGVTLADPSDGYAIVVDAIAEDIAAACVEGWSVDLTERCAIGDLRHLAVNARCFKSPSGVYALVIYHGLMNLMHKYTKLVVAAHDPSQVIYCNRKDPGSLTTEELLDWADELGPNYLTYGATRGAMLKLSTRAMAAVSPIVHLAETFILGHEAGHYLGGHMEEDASFSADAYAPSLQVFVENGRHALEFEADIYGFEIMTACSPSAPPETVHAAVLGAFSMMGLIGGDAAAASHPASSQRYQRIAERFGLPQTP
jgi:hypothetical protein